MLGPHALVAVREQHDEARLPDPLGLAGRDELVDDALGGVGEVAELRLPDHQRVGVGERVAELEAEDGVLGQRAVADDVLGLVEREVVEGREGFLVDLLVVEDVVAVAEGACVRLVGKN